MNANPPIPAANVVFAIGNEWDRYKKSNGEKLTTAEIKSAFQSYAVAMKTANANIKILGPSLSYKAALDKNFNQILPRLIGGADDLTGVIAGTGNSNLDNKKHYWDIVSFNTYPFNNSCTSADPSTNWPNPNDNTYLTQCAVNLTITSDYNNRRNAIISSPNNFANEIQDVKDLIGNISRLHAEPFTIAVTEMNINYFNPPWNPAGRPNDVNDQSKNSVFGLGAASFIAGQFWASMFAIGMEKGLDFLQPWSIHEKSGSRKIVDLGILDENYPNVKNRSTYTHFKILANNFKGSFLPNQYTTNASTHKAFGYKNTSLNEIGVLIMNMDEQQSVPRGTDNTTVSVGINTNGGTPSETINVSLNAGVSTVNYSCVITRETTMLIVFDITTGAVKRQEIYNLGQALASHDKLITNVTDYNNHIDIVHSSITVSPGTLITATSNKVFRATNKISINSTFSSGSQTLKLTTAPICQ